VFIIVEDKKMSEKNVSEISSCKTEKDSTKGVKIQKRKRVTKRLYCQVMK